MEKIKNQQASEKPEPNPSIDPALVRETFNLLASKGYIHFTETGAYIPTERGWKLLREVKTFRDSVTGEGCEKISGDSENSIKFVKNEEIDESVLAIKCNKGASELDEDVKNALKEGALVEIVIKVGLEEEKVIAYGSPALKLSGDYIEIRKDDEITDGTIGIMANKSAKDINPEILRKIKEGRKVEIEIIARL